MAHLPTRLRGAACESLLAGRKERSRELQLRAMQIHRPRSCPLQQHQRTQLQPSSWASALFREQAWLNPTRENQRHLIASIAPAPSSRSRCALQRLSAQHQKCSLAFDARLCALRTLARRDEQAKASRFARRWQLGSSELEARREPERALKKMSLRRTTTMRKTQRKLLIQLLVPN